MTLLQRIAVTIAVLCGVWPATAQAKSETIRVRAVAFSPFFGSWTGAGCNDEGGGSSATACTIDRFKNFETNETPVSSHPTPYTLNLAWERAGQQLVTFWSRNPGGSDYFCGAGFANDDGEIDLSVECELWDSASNPNPAIYLQIEGANAHGFTVSVAEQAALVWRSRAVSYDRNAGSLDLGKHYMGQRGTTAKSPGTDNWSSYWTAGGPTISTLRFSYETLEAMGLPTFASQWHLDHIIGGPHTKWSRVFFFHQPGKDGTLLHNLKAIPHELGHVIYNHLHSDEAHYWGEVTGYAKVHHECVPSFFNFAHYEGYANAMRDIIWRAHDPLARRGGAARFGCPTKGAGGSMVPMFDDGSLIERNVADFYYSLIFGFEDGTITRPSVGLDAEFFPSGVDYWLFPAAVMTDAVKTAGSDAHNLHDMAEQFLLSRCRQKKSGGGGTRSGLCSTQAFVCRMQEDRVLSNFDMEKLGFICDGDPQGSTGATCNENTDCRSGRCDAGFGTTGTNKCIPNDGKGKLGDYCTHPNHCSNKVCKANKCATKVSLGQTCAANVECWSGRCDAGLGTTGTNKCIPNDGTGKLGDYCTHPNHCSTKVCEAKKCATKANLGQACAANAECFSGRCDAGFGTTGTNKCIPNDGKGKLGDYCTHPNHCSTKVCRANKCASKADLGGSCSANPDCLSGACDPGKKKCVPIAGTGATNAFCTSNAHCASNSCSAGKCRSKASFGEYCGNGRVCLSGRCDQFNERKCIPNDGTGRKGDYCTHNNQCKSGNCPVPGPGKGTTCR